MAIATGAIGAGTGLAKFFEGRSMQKRAQGMIDNFQWDDLTNPYKDLQVSTLGSDLQTEQANINTATNTEAMRAGGTRALVGGLGRQQAMNNQMNRQIAADLDKQQQQINYAGAGQDVRNQQVMEQRQNNELAGYGQMLGAGQQMKFGGMTDILNTAGFAAQTAFGQGIDKSISNGVKGLFSRPEAQGLGLSPSAGVQSLQPFINNLPTSEIII